jgi:uncharacterized SAM-binding protein YcdF (DUF218 family)
MRSFFFVVVALVFVWCFGAFALDRYGATREVAQRAEAIVVAGCAVRANNQASDALARRVRRSVDLYRLGVAAKIIFTGGHGGGTITEAECSARLAESLGVPREDMILEGASHSTDENARFAKALTRATSVVVVTDNFHVLRSELIFRRYFNEVRGVGTTSTYLRTRAWGAFREVPLLAGSLSAL